MALTIQDIQDFVTTNINIINSSLSDNVSTDNVDSEKDKLIGKLAAFKLADEFIKFHIEVNESNIDPSKAETEPSSELDEVAPSGENPEAGIRTVAFRREESIPFEEWIYDFQVGSITTDGFMYLGKMDYDTYTQYLFSNNVWHRFSTGPWSMELPNDEELSVILKNANLLYKEGNKHDLIPKPHVYYWTRNHAYGDGLCMRYCTSGSLSHEWRGRNAQIGKIELTRKLVIKSKS